MSEDLETLLASLDAEPEVEINYDAPESGSFPPEVYPGRYRFIFALDPDEPWGKQTVGGKPYLQVTFTAQIEVPGKPEPVNVRFQRASMYKVEGRENHDIGELLRCLGVRADSPKPSDLVAALKQADGRAGGEAVFGWEAYSKDTQEQFRTSPRKRPDKKSGKVDMAWPKGADGKYEQTVKFPESGDSAYGRVRVISYKLPPKSANGQ